MAHAIAWNYVTPGHHPPDGNLEILPEYIDLDFLDLYKNEISKYGLKLSVLFYENYDQATDKYSNPVAKVIWQTQFDTNQNPPSPTEQIKTVGWMLDNGKWSEDKVKTIPVRNPKVFLQKMRSRVIDELVDLADKFNLADKLKTLYEQHSTEIYIYKEGGSPKFKQAIAASNEQWLTLPSTDGRTVRDVIIDYLSIGVVEDVA
ncbi:MAG: hypothetical protein AAGE96_05340 [Cyanobacteria bacterium P01_G01_bin.19]